MLLSPQCTPGVLVYDPSTYEQLSTTFRELPVGSLIAKHYEVLSVVGTGGMGIVYKTRHQLLNKTMAIKLLLHSEQSTSLIRFQREAQAASRLRHSNIVSVHEFGCTDGNQLYMVMDFVEGCTLAEAIESRGRLPLDEAIDIFIQICDAAAHAHANSVLHRDLKPGNILLTNHADVPPVVQIVDFGIAKLIDSTGAWDNSLTQSGQICGSPLYMSPEQVLTKTTDERSDIYSIGCMMYETLVGTPPIQGVNFIETIMKHINEPPRRLSETGVGKFPAKIEALVSRALAKDPAQRFQSAIELRDALIEFKNSTTQNLITLQTEPVPSRPLDRALKLAAMIGPILVFGTLAFMFLSGNPLDNSRSGGQRKASMLHAQLGALEPANAAEPSYGDLIGTLVTADPDTTFISRLDLFCDEEGEISADGAAITDRSMKKLPGYAGIRALSVNNTRVTDAGLGYLSHMPLRTLKIARTRVKGTGFNELRKIRTLERLDISHLKLEANVLDCLGGMNLYYLSASDDDLHDQDLVAVAKMKELNTLLLPSNCGITDGGISNIHALTQLSTLNLAGTRVSDAGLLHLSGLKNLKVLDLQNSQNIDDRAVAAVSHNWQLRELNLSSDKLTRKSMSYLTAMKSLRQLFVIGSGLSRQEIETLRNALPACDIHS